MKKACILFAIAIGACGKHGAPVSFGGKKVGDADFSMEIPPDWDQRVAPAAMVRFVARAPLESADDKYHETVNVVITTVGRSTTPDMLVQAARDRMAKQSGELRLQEVGSGNWSDSGFDGRFLEFRRSTESLKLHAIDYIILKDEKVYLLTCGAEDSTYDKYAPQFKQIAASFAPK